MELGCWRWRWSIQWVFYLLCTKESLGKLNVKSLDQLASEAALSHAIKYRDPRKSIANLRKPLNPSIQLTCVLIAAIAPIRHST